MRVLLEVRSTECKVDKCCVFARRIIADEMVPTIRQGTDPTIVFEPFELVQLKARGRIDVSGRERLAALIVEQHHARPVFFPYLLCGSPELHRLSWHMLVLHYHHGVTVIAQTPQVRDIVEHEHVTVHENGPAGVAG